MEPLAHPHRPSLEIEQRQIRDLVLEMGEMVDRAIDHATRALIDRDVQMASAVIADDAVLNARQAEVHEHCLSVILTQAPVARDLREILGFLHMSDELERMGDHCVNVARISRNLADLPPLGAPVDLAVLSRTCAEQVRDMLNALVARDIDRAREIASRDDRVDRMYHRIVDDILQLMVANSRDIYAGTQMILVAMNFERIADRVTNLAEDLVFLETGNVEELG
ncbi:MAG: phosphate signaling complex protein PhoU [Candidatus Dormibacteraeota bacterium]|uniref:Phosphate-specific transport system accessory protein PhoU n=1 Tax=Candidatus Aeolococcus gillhamiae TaxID=3127015 RepID=A0A934JT23_9BACT|nr:phosphate signaling complex protein PhoU [Candidatus Dormibacteraeota bacterium]